MDRVHLNNCSPLQCLSYLYRLVLIVAICTGLYIRWVKTMESIILIFLILAVFVLGLAIVLYYFCNLKCFSLGLLHLWYGALLGLLCFLNPTYLKDDMKEQVANYLLLASVALRILCTVLKRLLRHMRYRPSILTYKEWLELVGFAAASTVLPIQKSLSIMVLVVALITIIVALRMKSTLVLYNLLCFVGVTWYIFASSLNITTNPFAIACYFSHFICDPFLDFCFSGLSVTERWRPFLVSSNLLRRLSLVPLLLGELVFLNQAALKLFNLDHWYWMILRFVFVLFWLIYHITFVISVWSFHSKLSNCLRQYSPQGAEDSSLDNVMAAQGLRYYCLFSQRLTAITLISTVAVVALCWQGSNSLFLSASLLILNLESLYYGLFDGLGNGLGGTCVGYAVVIPTNCSSDGHPVLMPAEQMHQLNRRFTGMLSEMQRFFTHHLIKNFGCDYSSSGMTFDALETKIKSFLELQTDDGVRHDTYVIFYSGRTNKNGEWELAGGEVLRLDQILEWWREKNGNFSSRLIMVLDCNNSLPWVEGVRGVEGLYVAVQGATFTKAMNVENQHPPQLGDFTFQWVEYNCNSNSQIQWSERGRAIKAIYDISKNWSDYNPHLPVESDFTDQWMTNFPRIIHPIVRVALGNNSSSCPSPPDLFWRYLKRIRLNKFPPAILDTGHRFKLVKS